MPVVNPTDETWQAARAKVMLDPAVTQLNAGTCSPTPLPVFERVAALRHRQAQSPTEFQWRDSWELLRRSREALAGYLRANPRDLALVENVTVGLNIILQSLDLPAGSEILTSDHEYGSMVKLLHRLAGQRGWTVREARLPHRVETPQQIVDAFAAAVTPASKLMFFSHISSPSGLIFPAEQLVRLARDRGLISVIDGAHAPGHVDVDLAKLGADFYAANCHKWLMAPASVGFLHAGMRFKYRLRSIVSSWGHGYDPGKAEDDAHPGCTNWQFDLEFHGTSDRCPQMALPETIAFREQIGGDAAVHGRVRQLASYCRAKLGELGFKPWLADDHRLVGAMTAFELPERFSSTQPAFFTTVNDSPAQKLQRSLWEKHKIECPATHAAGKVFLRISTAWFNTTEEIDKLAAAVSETLRSS